MSRRVLAVVSLLCAGGAGAQTKLSVAGDSLSQAALADGVFPGDQPWNSWAYGTTTIVTSVLTRYRQTLNPSMDAEPVAEDGAKMMRDFYAQASRICSQAVRPDRVFVFLGMNDACYARRASWWQDPTTYMPNAAEFQAALHGGLDLLDSCLPSGAIVQVVSVVRVDFLVEAGRAENPYYCPAAWLAFDVCPTVTREPYPWRRRQIGRRIDQWNQAIAAEVGVMNARPAHRVTYVTDWQGSIDQGQQNTSAGTFVFGSPEINGLDCFHASTTGQRKLACLEWAKSLDGAPLFEGTAQSCLQ
jgi:lysophospholipase L1-like esterase